MFQSYPTSGPWRLRRQAVTVLFTADRMCHTLRRLWQQRFQATALGRTKALGHVKIALTRFSSIGVEGENSG
jgi:hypothetical protein